MDRIFRERVSGLTQRVADEVKITVMPESGVRLLSLSGLDGTPPAEGAQVPLWPLGTGDGAVIMAQLQVPAGLRPGAHPLVRVRLDYVDLFAQQPVSLEQTISAEAITGLTHYDPTWDLEILRNVTIQQIAEGMREIDRLFQSRRYEEAWRLAVTLEEALTEAAELTGDEAISKDIALMRRYQETLAEAVQRSQNRMPRLEDEAPISATPLRPYRGRPEFQPTPTPPLPVIDIK